MATHGGVSALLAPRWGGSAGVCQAVLTTIAENSRPHATTRAISGRGERPDYRIVGCWAKPGEMDLEFSLREGEVLAGRYQLERQLGAGGMGLVYAATHLELGRRVAIKLLRAESGANASVTARFLLEARATARLNGPHVAKVLDIGRLDEHTPYLVMEYLEGSNLQELLVQQGPLPVPQSVDYLMDACEALAEAHRASIVHRDLKPANLFLTRDAYGDPSIKVLDFGISKFLEPSGDGALGLTDSRALMGSPVYMSPEQMRSARDVDHRTDIWSLGAVLFELLTGRAVWTGQSLSELCAQVARDPAPNVCEFCPQATAELSTIIARCLQKDVALRFQQVTDLALALERFASPRGKSTLAHVLVLAGQKGAHHQPTNAGRDADALHAQSPSESTLQGTAATHPSADRHRMPIVAVGAVGAILLTFATAYFWLRPAAKVLSTNALSSAATTPTVTSAPAPQRADLPGIPANRVAAIPSASVTAASMTPTVRGARASRAITAVKAVSPSTASSPVPSADPMSIRK